MSTATLHSEKKKTLIPQLRFKGFDGFWKEILLEDFAKRGSGHTPNKSYPEYYNGEINWISLTDSKKLDNGYIEFTNTKITQLGLDNSSAVLHPAGSVLLSRDAGVGKSAVMKHSMAVSQHFIVWSPKENFSSNWFLYNVLQILKPEFERIAIGSTIKTIGLPYFKKLKITVPTFPEQQKIASFLSAVDEKIQQLSRKKELLEQYKKGVMQQLFSGKLRFKDENGEDYPDWEEKKLGEVCDVRDGTHDSPKYVDKGFPFITSKNLMKNGSIDFENVSFINELDYNKVNQRSKVNINDILFGMIGTIGNPVLVKSEGFAIKNVALIKEKKDLLNLFLIHFLKGDSINQQFFEQNTGGTQKFLSLSVIRNLIAIVPPLPEQQKIANFLSSIDIKIENVNGEIGKTQLFKKGLLQQMFV